jgi:site-specific recombinase XerD
MLGHESIETTAIHTHVSTRDLQKNRQSIRPIINPKPRQKASFRF